MTKRIVIYKARRNLTTMSRTIEEGMPLPSHYYFTKKEAVAAAKAHNEAVAADRKRVEPLALVKFHQLAADFNNFVDQLHEKYGADIYADGTACDDTGIATWLEVVITQQGTYVHQFVYQLD